MAAFALTTALTTLFTDIVGAAQFWETDAVHMHVAREHHDQAMRALIAQHGGTLIKLTTDGAHAVFEDPLQAVLAGLGLLLALREPEPQSGLRLPVRCGLHLGSDQRRDGDFFGVHVNRAARIMGLAQGGQMLMSDAVARNVMQRLPPSVTLKDLGKVRLRDLELPEHVHQLLHPALRAHFPAPRSLANAPNNLPQQRSSLYGREALLADALTLLRSGRMLTLTGIGGVGKSRLALHVGAEALDVFPDGVWHVPLADHTETAALVQALAAVLGVEAAAGQALDAALLNVVRDRTLLLLLDDMDGAARSGAVLIKRLLQAAPGVKVLATCRQPLLFAGEQALRVPPLAVPEATAAHDLDRLHASPAVALFVNRAQDVDASFRLNAGNAVAVQALCAALDGLPRALELAALQLRHQGLAHWVEHLDNALDWLIDTLPTLPSTPNTPYTPTTPLRARAQRAAFDEAVAQLSMPARKLLQRLALLQPPWMLAQTEGACADLAMDPADVLDLLSTLVDHALVDCDAAGYRMLRLTQSYALAMRDAQQKSTAGSTHEPTASSTHDALAGAMQATAPLAVPSPSTTASLAPTRKPTPKGEVR